ncbi:TonB-dependent receptor [Pseudocolwellia sp. HL-MZ19]|uniref:TonB-dependent receptor n=1 Tax=Pseudocolwellia sp. HL-MZ19 TaxID=3400846 RepID=UPI003CEAE473
MKYNKILLALSAALTLGTPTVVNAENVLEVINITASKKSQSLQTSNVAVTAFSGDTLRELNMTDSTDLANQTPGLNIGTPVGEGNNPSISLRGVGLNDFNDNNEGPIAVYRDEVYQSAMPGLTFQLFDLERVEVLRGPQGTLYGRNATGGLVHFISKKPTEDLEGFASVTLAEYNQIKTEAAISGGLTDTIQARLSIATNNHDGYVENRIGPDANEADNQAVRLQVNFDLSDNLTALVNLHAAKSDTIAPKYQHQVTTEDGVDFFGYADTDNDVFAGDYDRDGILKIDSKGASVNLAYAGDNFDFYSITAIEDVEKLHQEDTDLGPTAGIEPQFASTIEQFSQEFRVEFTAGEMDWMVGAFYFENEVEGALDLAINYPGAVVDGITGAPAGTFGTDFLPFVDYDIDYVQETDSMGLFGQVEMDLNDDFRLTLGLRYTTEERTMEYVNLTTTNPDAVVNSCLIPAGDVCGFGLGSDFPGTNTYLDFSSNNPDVASGGLNKIDDDNISGRISLDYTASQDVLIFANIATGFKSGGFNGGFLDFTDGVAVEDVPFDSEELTSYEIGVKSTLADGDVRLNATAFYYDYKDYQALSFSGLSQFINNSDAKVSGADIELTWLPGDNWDINLGVSLINSEVDEVVVRGTGTVTGNEMVQAPNFSLNGLVRYQATEKMSFQIDFNHQSEQYFDITNSDLSKEGSYSIFNARIGYDISENLSISAFVKNLANEEYRVYSFDFTSPAGLNQNFYAPPRWAGVSIAYTFE